MLSLSLLKKERLQALRQKNKVKSSVLSTLLGEMQISEKNGLVIDEPYIVKQITTLSKKAEENLLICEDTGRDVQAATFRAEIDECTELLKHSSLVELSVDEIVEIIEQLGATSMAQMSEVMRYLRSNFEGRHNPSLVSQIVKKTLSR